MSQKTKTVVLTSRENFVWISMQEIIPSVDAAWLKSSCDNHEVKVLTIEDYTFSKIVPEVLLADNIVFTCFTFTLAKMAEFIRNTMQINARFIVHLNSLSTISLWPAYRWGMGEVFKNSDIFISTCKRDQQCLKVTYENPNSELVPFNLSRLNSEESEELTSYEFDAPELCFVGRISSQKNLHTLIYSLYLLKKGNSSLDFNLKIFGGEDNLGSPNMELYREGYQEYLENLIIQLGLQGNIKIMGFVERSVLRRKYLNKPHLLVSSSLHSDENFGISAVRSLSKGCPAVLSDWGGHTDHKEKFGEQVDLVPVYKTSAGPVINPIELSKILCKSITNNLKIYKKPLPSYYSEDYIANRLQQIALKPFCEDGLLKADKVLDELLTKQEMYLESNMQKAKGAEIRKIGCKIFESYEDKNAHKYLEAYGMENTIQFENYNEALIPPWVTISGDKISISDFHRGNFSIKCEEGSSLLKDYNDRSFPVSEKTLKELVNLGYAFT